MKTADLRKLIGAELEWEYNHDPHRGTCFVATGIILDVKGRNVLIDQHGSSDWKWLPNMVNLKVIKQPPNATAPKKPLKLWNGRGHCCRKDGDPLWAKVRANDPPHAYIAAASRADALRIIEAYSGRKAPANELKTYWSEGVWGDRMNGVEPERGLWLAFDPKTPIKVF